jgi:hypothetical protein
MDITLNIITFQVLKRNQGHFILANSFDWKETLYKKSFYEIAKITSKW